MFCYVQYAMYHPFIVIFSVAEYLHISAYFLSMDTLLVVVDFPVATTVYASNRSKTSPRLLGIVNSYISSDQLIY